MIRLRMFVQTILLLVLSDFLNMYYELNFLYECIPEDKLIIRFILKIFYWCVIGGIIFFVDWRTVKENFVAKFENSALITAILGITCLYTFYSPRGVLSSDCRNIDPLCVMIGVFAYPQLVMMLAITLIYAFLCIMNKVRKRRNAK